MGNEFKHHTQDKSGGLYVTLNQLVKMFYVSRFNRDNMHDPAENEDIDNSRKYRIYNLVDVKELLNVFIEFCEWAFNEKNISRLYLSPNLTLNRESLGPKLKYATGLEEMYTNMGYKNGEYYITDGKYNWVLNVKGEPYTKMKELWLKDPVFAQKKEELRPIMEEKNAKSKDSN